MLDRRGIVRRHVLNLEVEFMPEFGCGTAVDPQAPTGGLFDLSPLRAVVGAIATAALLSVASPSAASEYFTFVQDINDQGWITGAFYDSAGGHGFIRKNGVYSTIDAPGSNYTYPTSINSNGDVAGLYEDSGGVRHGFVYKDGVFSTIDPAGSISTEIRGINDSGATSGYYLDGPSYTTIAYTAEGGAYTVFDHPLASPSRTLISGINNAGDFTGRYFPAGGPPLSFVSLNGVVTDFGFPSSGGTQAQDINDLGQVAGWYSMSGQRFGFIWSAGGFTSLGFPGVYPQDTEAWGINNLGDVVGTFHQDGNAHGFIYSKGLFTQIDHPDAFRPISGVPEPTTWAMMIIGFGFVGAAMRRARPVLSPCN